MVNQMYMKVLARLESVASTTAEKDAINAVRGRYVQQFGTDNEYVNSLSKLESVASTKAEQEQINTIRGKYGLFEMTYGVDNDEDRLSDEIGTAMHVEPVSEKDIENSVSGEPNNEPSEKTYEDFEDAIKKLSKLLVVAPRDPEDFTIAVYQSLNDHILDDDYCPPRVRRVAENINIDKVISGKRTNSFGDKYYDNPKDPNNVYIDIFSRYLPAAAVPITIQLNYKKVSPNGKAFTWKTLSKQVNIPCLAIGPKILIDFEWYNLLTENSIDNYSAEARRLRVPTLGFKVYLFSQQYPADKEILKGTFNGIDLYEYIGNAVNDDSLKTKIYKDVNDGLAYVDNLDRRERHDNEVKQARGENPTNDDYYETAWNHYKSPGNFDDTEPSGDDTAKKTRVASTLYDYSNRDPENPFDESVNGKGKSV